VKALVKKFGELMVSPRNMVKWGNLYYFGGHSDCKLLYLTNKHVFENSLLVADLITTRGGTGMSGNVVPTLFLVMGTRPHTFVISLTW